MSEIEVFLHTKSDDPQAKWKNVGLILTRLPALGEHITLGDDTPYWYKVVLVLHCPKGPQYKAEVYAIAVNHLEAMKSIK